MMKMTKKINTDGLSAAVYSMLLMSIFFFSCTKIPQNVGKTREIIVVSSKVDTNLIIKNLQLYNYVPQKEGLFKFICISDSAIEKYDKFHTIFLYGSLEDEFINLLLNRDAKKATEKDTFTLFKLNDLWAKGQLAIILVTARPEYIQPGIEKYKELLVKILEENYYSRIKENYYTKHFDKQLKKSLKRFGIVFDLDKQWLIDSTYKNENFIFVHAHFPDRSIFFYKEKLNGELTKAFAVAKRNSLTGKYYDGDYILEELTDIEKIEFKNMKGIRMKGVWQNDSLVAGGPFLSYFLTHRDTLYVIDGLLFNPGERKSEYFTTLEVILNSFELVE
ncbi:MAG TPA: DUF4837 family protein [candidate division WOR-3 bacterium]|uniref:DUF4837 family protein n=1 Tax=candidate division WOR-3 bacterium TaxID=2052148 RepID=A0A9C9JZP5_UNCW3|nr:DUF4837 family protein [candidate division WOR-3 bacterium]